MHFEVFSIILITNQYSAFNYVIQIYQSVRLAIKH